MFRLIGGLVFCVSVIIGCNRQDENVRREEYLRRREAFLERETAKYRSKGYDSQEARRWAEAELSRYND